MAEKEYIEREAVRKLICGFCADCDGTTDLCEYRDIQVDAIPAADVRPVMRGKWVITTERFAPERICSSCKCRFPVLAGEGITEILNFCPNCGARMEES